MNTNLSVKRILCFGDSNTWGRVPGDDNNLRYEADKRWTGVLQNLLGDGFEILDDVLVSDLDGVHLDGESHKILAKVIYQKVLKYFNYY